MSDPALCWLCGRRLRLPSPDGLGPVCRRKLHPPRPTPPVPDRPTPAELEAAGQLAIPVQPPLTA